MRFQKVKSEVLKGSKKVDKKHYVPLHHRNKKGQKYQWKGFTSQRNSQRNFQMVKGGKHEVKLPKEVIMTSIGSLLIK